jgi:hypothetical protein
MTQERRLQAQDHRTQAERCIEGVGDPGRDDNATAAGVGSKRAVVSTRTRTHAPPTHRPRVIPQCAS